MHERPLLCVRLLPLTLYILGLVVDEGSTTVTNSVLLHIAREDPYILAEFLKTH